MSTYVTRPFLPPKEEYLKRVSDVFDRAILTNQGPEVLELETRLKSYLGALNFQYVANGTVAIQIAMRALDITEGEIITTPFSYVATTSTILWERCSPVFVDIEPNNFTIDPLKIEASITPRTKAIMPVHVFGYACNVEAIQEIADKHGLKVIYDAAHSFGSRYKGKALSTYGDIATLSFHATKLFHTLEGGGCVIRDTEIAEKLDLIKRFGHIGDNHYTLGINAKQDELNAAMGNVNINYINEIIAWRKQASEKYDDLLASRLQRPRQQEGLEYNYAYYPVVFQQEKDLIAAFKALEKVDVFARRYFYPSLNTLPYLDKRIDCPISQDICSRIACLPLYYGIEDDVIECVCKQILNNI